MTLGWGGRIKRQKIGAVTFVNSALTIQNKVADNSQVCSDLGTDVTKQDY